MTDFAALMKEIIEGASGSSNRIPATALLLQVFYLEEVTRLQIEA